MVDPFTEAQPLLPLRIINPHSGLSIRTWGVIDTGAKTTLIPKGIADDLKHDWQKGVAVKGPTAGGELRAYQHTFEIDVLGMDVQGKVDEGIVEAVIPRQQIPVADFQMVLVGVKEFLRNYILEIDYPQRVFSLRKAALSS